MQNNIYEININKLLECINSLEKRIETLEKFEKELRERSVDLLKMIEKVSDDTLHICKALLKIERNK